MFDWLNTLMGGKSKPGSQAFARDILAQSWEAFRLARHDRPGEHFQPRGFSGDAAVIGSQDLMHRRTRDLVRNTAQAKTIQRAFMNLVVGKGMQTFAWPFLPSEMFQIITELESLEGGELGPRLQFALESDDLFDEYSSDRNQFDAENRLTAPEMLRMLMGECVTVGNGLMVRVFRRDFDPDKHLVPLSWQLFEREQLNESLDRDATPGNNKILGGLEINDQNQTVAYHLYLDHPHDFFGAASSRLQGAPSGSGGRTIRVDAERVIDLALYDRPSSSLGHSWLDAAGQSIWDRDSYMESEMRTAAVDSVFAFVAKLNDAEKYGAWGFADGGDNEDEHGNREFKVGHSPAAAIIGTEESLEMVRPTRPNRDAPPFIKLQDRDISAAAGLSYYTLTGDYEGTNFSSSRAAKLDEDLDMAPLQQWFGCRVALPIRQQFNALAAAAGHFQSIGPAEFMRKRRTYQRFETVGQGRDLLDPFKEGEARTARLRTGISTFKEECAKRGTHWIRVLMQQAIEKRVFVMFGVQPDFSKAGSGASGKPADGGDVADEIADRVAMLLEDLR